VWANIRGFRIKKKTKFSPMRMRNSSTLKVRRKKAGQREKRNIA